MITRSHTGGSAPPRGQLRQRSGREVTSSSCTPLDDASTVAAAAQARLHRPGRAGACQSSTALRQHAGSCSPRRRGCCSRRRPRASREGRRCGGASSVCLRPERRSGDAGTIGSPAQPGGSRQLQDVTALLLASELLRVALPLHRWRCRLLACSAVSSTHVKRHGSHHRADAVEPVPPSIGSSMGSSIAIR